jgi:hypothetical protein
VTVPLRILANGARPVLSFYEPFTNVNKSAGAGSVDLLLSRASAEPIMATFTVSGSAATGSYVLTPAEQVVFAPGETTKTLQLNLLSVAFGQVTDVTTPLTTPTGDVDVDSDPLKNTHSFYVIDDTSGSLFQITGVTGGADTTADGWLTDGNTPTVNWVSIPNATEYDITIYNDAAGTSVKCPTYTSTTASDNSHVFSTCALTNGTTYYIKAVAIVEGTPNNAGNNMMPFTNDTTLPSGLTITGVMGGVSDFVPDMYLAGTTSPTVVWSAATHAGGYKVKILETDGTTVACPEVSVSGSVTAVAFPSCTLTAGNHYLVSMKAVSSAGLESSAINDNFNFLVTTTPANYALLGATGGSSDVTADGYLDDVGANNQFTISWEATSGITSFDVVLLNMDNTVKCPLVNVPGSASSVDIVGCLLDLNQQYKIKVTGYDVNGLSYPAIGSPMPMIFRSGLYISGNAAAGKGSYYHGIPITTCGGTNVCNAANPYKLNQNIYESQIRVSDGGVMVGGAWTSGSPTIGNGILSFEADYLVVDQGSGTTPGLISMDGRGWTSGNGTCPGVDSSTASVGATGGCHGGYGSVNATLGQATGTYGDIKNPATLGSPGGNYSTTSLGGAGGGIVQIVVHQKLTFGGGSITSNGAAGAYTGSQASGGGSGGSVIVTTEDVAGSNGSIKATGGNASSSGNGGGGSGGHVAFYYDTASYAGGVRGIGLSAQAGTNAGSSAKQNLYTAASGTIFYKATADTIGNLVIDNGTLPHVQGAETPIPLADVFDSISTRGTATFLIPTSQTYQLLTPTLTYRLAVAGTLTLPSAAPANSTNLVVDSGGYFEWRRSDPLNQYATIDVRSNGVLTHSLNLNSTPDYELDIAATSVAVEGKISADGAGYAPGNGSSGAGSNSGGGYGGSGGQFPVAVATVRGSAVDIDPKNPSDLGNPGAGTTAGSGGGRIEITASNLSLTGTISANGGPGSGATGGGGSGGAVVLNISGSITGAGGSVTASGGDGSGGGGGGRIAVLYGGTTYAGGITGINLIAYGGIGNGDGTTFGEDGGAGTIFYQQNSVDPNGHLLVKNGTRNYNEFVTTPILRTEIFDSWTTDLSGTIEIPTGLNVTLPSNTIDYRLILTGDLTLPSGNDLTIASGGYLEMRKLSALALAGDFTVQSGGVLTHTHNLSTESYVAKVTANNITISGTVDAGGRGYSDANGPGKANDHYAGAGHGGIGGSGASGANNGVAYDDIKAPSDLGSGGYDWYSSGNQIGGDGGGLISLSATQTLTLSGYLTADGTAALGSSGAGSGGTVVLNAATLAGAGAVVSANGGSGNGGVCGAANCYDGSGSGGRISITYTTDSYASGVPAQLTSTKFRAMGSYIGDSRAGAAGTIYLNHLGDSVCAPNGDLNSDGNCEKLYINNASNPHVQNVETPLKGSDYYDQIISENQATYLVNSSDTYTMPTPTLDYRLSVIGTLTVPTGNLTINSGGWLDWRNTTPVTLTSVTINNGGTVTHSQNYSTQAYQLVLNVTDLTLNGGSIDVDGKGYGGLYTSNGSGGDTSSSSVQYGGSHGGVGGGSLSTYDDYYSPAVIGSGGGPTSGPYSYGGGYVKIAASGTVTLNGTISANGDNGSSSTPGGAAGGAIDITADTIAGSSAVVRADGSNGSSGSYAGGGGGRIAIKYNHDNYDLPGIASANLSAHGGSSTAAAGTIFLRNLLTQTYGTLIVKNAGNTYGEPQVTTLPNGGQFDQIITDNGAAVLIPSGQSFTLDRNNINYHLVLGGDVYLPSGDTLTIQNGGTLEFRRATAMTTIPKIIVDAGGLIDSSTNSVVTSGKLYEVNISATDLTLNGDIKVSGKGYAADQSGNGSTSYGPGTSASRSGSYGGLAYKAGNSFDSSGNTITPAATYGSIKNPDDLGSGGSGSDCSGGPCNYAGAGGGEVMLNLTGTLTLNGTIRADGAGGNHAGSGGAVNITTVNLAGSNGLITAYGAGTSNGSAGGGRIAVNYTSDSSYNGGISGLRLRADGGGGSVAGAAGSIFYKQAAETNGHLVVDNHGLLWNLGTETALSADTFDTISITTGSGVYIPSAVTACLGTSTIDFPIRAVGTPTWGASCLASDNVTFLSGGKFYADSTSVYPFTSLDMESGSTLSHTMNTVTTSTPNKALKISVSGNFTMKEGSTVDVSGKGNPSQLGSFKGQNASSGSTPPVWGGGGGGHGGQGGGVDTSADIVSGGAGVRGMISDDDPNNPQEIGSSGGVSTDYWNGPVNGQEKTGSEGGGIFIANVAGTFDFEGSIKADGNAGNTRTSGSSSGGGGGAGGSINITTNNLTGAYGTMSAKGGNGGAGLCLSLATNGGSGGGGMIRLSVSGTNSYSGGTPSFDASTGTASADRLGNAGTVVFP